PESRVARNRFRSHAASRRAHRSFPDTLAHAPRPDRSTLRSHTTPLTGPPYPQPQTHTQSPVVSLAQHERLLQSATPALRPLSSCATTAFRRAPPRGLESSYARRSRRVVAPSTMSLPFACESAASTNVGRAR